MRHAKANDFEHIDLHLVRVLHTVITERSVSRAALHLGSTQPLVSSQLRRLRALTGDPLLVRAGQEMVPTERAKQLVGPAEDILSGVERLLAKPASTVPFAPARAQGVIHLAASDYLDPFFLPAAVSRMRHLAPGLQINIRPLSGELDYRRELAAGKLDLVIGNWPQPPAELHLARLLRDEVVCLVSAQHPAVRAAAGRAWTVERYLACDHVGPAPLRPGAQGVIDDLLAQQGHRRTVMVRASHFSLIPLMVAQSLLVLTTGRLFCSRYADVWPLKIVRCPAELPPLNYYQLWHDVTHHSPMHRWVREQIKAVVSALPERAGRLGVEAMP